MTDFDPRHAVDQMADEVRRGRTPQALAELLQRQSAPRGSEHGPLLRWLSGARPRTFEATAVLPFDDGGFFQRSCVFRLMARDRVFERPTLPGGGSFGLCALGPEGLRCLEHHQDDVEALLRGVDAEVQRCEPRILASLLLEALESGPHAGHGVLESADHLLHYGRDQSWARHGYRVSASEWDRVRARVVSPTLVPDATATWRLECCSVLGWMHDKRTLVWHRYRFSPRQVEPYRTASSFRIEHEQQVLSRRIFDRVPDLRY